MPLPYDYYARRCLPNPIMPGYQPGDGIYAQVVDDAGWVLGIDVDAAREDLIERPADGATREKWVNYVLSKEPGLAREELDDLGRNDLIARVDGPPAKTPEKATARKATKAASESSDDADKSESGD